VTVNRSVRTPSNSCHCARDSPDLYGARARNALAAKRTIRRVFARAREDYRLLFVTGFASASVLGGNGSRLPTDHVGMARPQAVPWHSTLSAA
jgi:hypothetical protein